MRVRSVPSKVISWKTVTDILQDRSLTYLFRNKSNGVILRQICIGKGLTPQVNMDAFLAKCAPTDDVVNKA